MNARPALLVSGDLTVKTGSATIDLRGTGDHLQIRFRRLRDAFTLFGERRRASGVRELAASVDVTVAVFVRGVRVPAWVTS